MKLLLHICCGPCSLSVIDQLRAFTDCPLEGLFANPNIHPYEEFLRRRESTALACTAKQVPLHVLEDFDQKKWETFADSDELRCKMCYTVRAALTAQKAAELNCKYFTSTLFVSPYQNHELMKELFEQAGREHGVTFFYRDFRPGFRQGQLQARETGLYRQKYCGCIKSFYGE